MKLLRFFPTLAVLSTLLSAPALRAFDLTFTNRSEYADSEVYVWFSAAPGYQLRAKGQKGNLLLGRSYPLAELKAGVETDVFISGRVYFSFATPLPDPGRGPHGTPVRNPGVLPGDDGYQIRHDFVELTYTPSPADVADLTSMDQFAIPCTLQLRRGGKPLVGSSTFAGWKGHSDRQVVGALSRLVEPARSNLFAHEGRFIRVQGATKFPRLYRNTPDDPRSLANYLQVIRRANRATVIKGTAFGATYVYEAKLDANGDYILERMAEADPKTPRTIRVPGSYRSGPNPADATVTMAEAIYLSNPWYSVDGGKIGPTQNNLAGAVARDLFAALNLGYVHSDHIVAAHETADPALVGRVIGDLNTDQMRSLKVAFSEVNSFYNIYADAIRKLSDSYGYAYSDWNEHLSKVAVLINAPHGGEVADELKIEIFGSRNP